MAAPPPPPPPPPPQEERRTRRGVGQLLSAFYGIEGDDKKKASAEPELDRQGFDAQRYFDSVVATGKVADVLKVANEVNSEVKNLDSDQQMIAYENYSKFIRATDVTKQMKVTIEAMEPDLQSLESSINRIADQHRKVEDAVSSRAHQIEALLRQQRVCQKVRVLFSLPQTLQRCLAKGAYGQAAQAYSSCVPFLRTYKEISSFRKVLEDVELQMGQIRTALERQLRSSALSVDEAVSSSATLLDLGEDRMRVATGYLGGRDVALKECLQLCFTPDANSNDAEKEPDEAEPGEELQTACTRTIEQFLPMLSDTVEGFQKMQRQESRSPEVSATVGLDEALSQLVSSRVEDLFDRISKLVQQSHPSARLLVSCVESLKNALRRVHSLMPRLFGQLFTAFLSRVASTSAKSLFAAAAADMTSDLEKLQQVCKTLQDSKSANLDSLLEEVRQTEQSVISHGLVALGECQPLFGLIGTDHSACKQLCHELNEQLTGFFMTFAGVCNIYLGRDRAEGCAACASLSSDADSADLGAFAGVEWVGLFALSLVCMGRHLEEKAINKFWALVKDFSPGNEAASDRLPASAVAGAVESTIEALMTHYVLISGHKLAHYFRNHLHASRKKLMQAREEPKEPSLVVEMVLKEVLAFDGQLARILSDPRKSRGAGHRKGVFSRNKNSMELQMDTLWAKKLQVFAPIPLNRNGAIMGILRIAFKALYEYVREQTFAKMGLQQLQLDCALLAEVCRDFVGVEDANLLESLLGEVVNSASQRCADPVLMEAVALETLCDEKKKGLRSE